MLKMTYDSTSANYSQTLQKYVGVNKPRIALKALQSVT